MLLSIQAYASMESDHVECVFCVLLFLLETNDISKYKSPDSVKYRTLHPLNVKCFCYSRRFWSSPASPPSRSSSRYLSFFPSSSTTAAAIVVRGTQRKKRTTTTPAVAMDTVAKRGGASVVSHGCRLQPWRCVGNTKLLTVIFICCTLLF